MASDDLSLFSNLALDDAATSTSTGTVCEPTAASSGADLLVTGNWFASRSSDAGQSWQFVDPATMFPASMGGFCCDQVALYEPSRDLWIWLLQYNTDATGTNLFRARPPTPPDSGRTAGRGGTTRRRSSTPLGPTSGSTTRMPP